MTDHLADCDDYAFSGAGFHPNCERICICRQVRRIEKRVLDAAREAVESVWTIDPSWDGTNWNNALHEAIVAIDALREKP